MAKTDCITGAQAELLDLLANEAKTPTGGR
jgi:hypothetical protein